MAVTLRKALKYSLLPGILPRIVRLFSSGFSHFSLYIACVFRSVRLLPAGHPYLSGDNIGRFGIRHVLAEARRNLVYSRQNIDQIIIYYTILLGIFLMGFQFFMMILSVLAQTAHAGGISPAYLSQFFSTADASNDIAFVLMDMIFGVHGVFLDIAGNGTCIAQNIPCFPRPGAVSYGAWPTGWHTAMLGAFQFYNTGVLAVGLIVFLYLAVTTAVETAESGTPFGQRFNRVWAPTRMIFALALLVMIPMNGGGSAGPAQYGMNVAQMITLHIAKWGSGLATNGWERFNVSLNTSASGVLGAPNQLVYNPTPPMINNFLEFMMIAHTCIAAERSINGRNVEFYQIRAARPAVVAGPNGVPAAQPAVTAAAAPMAPTLGAAIAFAMGTTQSQIPDIYIRAGEQRPEYVDQPGNTAPVCGEFVFSIKDLAAPGAFTLQQGYYNSIYQMAVLDPLFQADGEAFAQRITPSGDKDPLSSISATPTIKTNYISYYTTQLRNAITAGRLAQINDPRWVGGIIDHGWAGAGMWYNKIAEYNGTLVASAYGLPVPTRYPQVMESVSKERARAFSEVTTTERFNPSLPNNEYVNLEQPNDLYVAIALYNAQTYWNSLYESSHGNTFVDIVRTFFGVDGLYNFLNNTEVNPLVQLTGIGRSMVESAMTNMGIAVGSGIAGGIASLMGMGEVGTIGKSLGSVAMQIAVLGLSMGFVMFYVVPMLPFVYFLFSLGEWVKTVFEAMVGLPLWAMAHIRIDGEGLPGSAGLNGYFLLLDIFIRPILTVFGLISGVLIFSAQMFVLHSVWGELISNVTGFNFSAPGLPPVGSGLAGSVEYADNTIGTFFTTIIYAIIAYMMAVGSFKLVDQIPDNMLRWMGGSVKTFGESAHDPADNLVQMTFMGTQMISGKMNAGLQSLLLRNK